MSTVTHLEYPRELKEQAKAVLESLTPELPPLRLDAGCVLRVSPTRVRLDTVIYAFNTGSTAAEIRADYSSLELADIYLVIAYYLRHREIIDASLKEREKFAAEVRREIEAEEPFAKIRERLLARRAATE
jgi:uncharacterized protein (DUF433 family)